MKDRFAFQFRAVSRQFLKKILARRTILVKPVGLFLGLTLQDSNMLP